MRRHQPKTATLLAGLPSFGGRYFQAAGSQSPLCDNISSRLRGHRKASRVAGIAVDDIGWNDVGSWSAVYDLAKKDRDGNASRNELIAESSSGNFVDAAKLVALAGVENLIVVDTPDALLIASRANAQDVSKIVKNWTRRSATNSYKTESGRLNRRLRVFENLLKRGDGAIHVLLREDIRRQEAQNRVVRAVEQQPFLHAIEHQLLARKIEFHANHQARVRGLP